MNHDHREYIYSNGINAVFLRRERRQYDGKGSRSARKIRGILLATINKINIIVNVTARYLYIVSSILRL